MKSLEKVYLCNQLIKDNNLKMIIPDTFKMQKQLSKFWKAKSKYQNLPLKGDSEIK